MPDREVRPHSLPAAPQVRRVRPRVVVRRQPRQLGLAPLAAQLHRAGGGHDPVAGGGTGTPPVVLGGAHRGEHDGTEVVEPPEQRQIQPARAEVVGQPVQPDDVPAGAAPQGRRQGAQVGPGVRRVHTVTLQGAHGVPRGVRRARVRLAEEQHQAGAGQQGAQRPRRSRGGRTAARRASPAPAVSATPRTPAVPPHRPAATRPAPGPCRSGGAALPPRARGRCRRGSRCGRRCRRDGRRTLGPPAPCALR